MCCEDVLLVFMICFDVLVDVDIVCLDELVLVMCSDVLVFVMCCCDVPVLRSSSVHML